MYRLLSLLVAYEISIVVNECRDNGMKLSLGDLPEYERIHSAFFLFRATIPCRFRVVCDDVIWFRTNEHKVDRAYRFRSNRFCLS